MGVSPPGPWEAETAVVRPQAAPDPPPSTGTRTQPVSAGRHRHAPAMRSQVPAVLRAAGGVSTWSALAAATSDSAVDRAVASGAAVLGLPGVLLLADVADDDAARRRAALAYAGDGALLSHTTALQVHGLPLPAPDPVVHVVVPHRRQRRTAREHPVAVVVHRSRSRPPSTVRGGDPVVALETAVVQSWPLLRGSDQRAPALVAVRRRLTTATALREELQQRRVLPQRPALLRLVEAIADGCRSELELWGYEQVFTGTDFAELRRQVEVVVDGRLAVLDCYDPRAALAIELDGRQYHDSPRDRERDAERDVRLASVGIQTVRFSHRRLTRSPEDCRREALRTQETRRTQLAGRPRPLVVEVPGRAGGEPRLRLALPAAVRGA